jgi:hypothetical protein
MTIALSGAVRLLTPPIALTATAAILVAPATAEPVAEPDSTDRVEVVEVTAQAGDTAGRVATGVRRVDAEAASALPNPADDVFHLVRLLPGVTSDETGAEFHVRGGGTDETLVRIDGLEVRQLFHGRDYGGITGIVPRAAVKGVEFYPGGYPARYGGKLSGVVDVRLRTEGPAGLHGTVGADAVSARAFVESQSDAGALQVSVREGYLDRILRAVRDDFSAESGYRDLLLRGVRRGGPGTSVSFNYLRSEDHIYYDDGVELHDVNADYVDHYLWSTARWASRRADLDATAHWTLGRQRRLVGGEGNHDDQHVKRMGARLEAALYPGGRHVVRVGGAADRERGWFRYRSEETVSVSAEGDTETHADFEEEGAFDRVRSSLFVQDEWRPLRPLAVNVGVRAAHDTDTDDWRAVPRASSALELPRGWTLRGAWGVYEQAPQVGIDLEQDVQLRSDRTNRAVHRILGLEKAVGSARVGLDAWDKDFTDLDGIVTRAADGTLERHVVTEGFAEGLELWIDRSTASSSWWFSYTLGRSQWSSGERTFDRDFDRLHAFSLSNTFTLSRDWDIGTAYTFHTGTPYTEQVWQLDDFQRQWVMEEGEPNSERLPSYQRFDLQVRRHFRFEGWAMTVYAEGLNLTNHENVLWYSWRLADRDGQRQPERITRTGVPGLPSVGVEVRF